MSRRAKKPAIVVVSPVRARPIRGPHRDGSGRWYWRAELYKGQDGVGRTIWTGWELEDNVGPLLIKQIAEQGLDKAQEEDDGEVRTVQDLLESWLGSRKDSALSDRTKSATKASCTRLTGPKEARTELGQVLLTRLDRAHLERWRDTCGHAESTVSYDLTTLRIAWKWGRDTGRTPDRSLPVLRRAGKPRAAKPVYTRFTPTEAQVAAVIEKIRRPWAKRAVLLLYATGARVGEISTLRWGAIAPYWRALPTTRGTLADLPDDLHLSWTARDCSALVVDGKTGPREVPLHPSVAAEVLSWRPEGVDPNAYVLGVKPKSAAVGVQVELADAAEALKLPRLSPNGLRRAAERALYRTREIDVAASIMGHSAETAIRIYREVTGDERGKLVRVAGLAIPVAAAGDVIEGPWKAVNGDVER